MREQIPVPRQEAPDERRRPIQERLLKAAFHGVVFDALFTYDIEWDKIEFNVNKNLQEVLDKIEIVVGRTQKPSIDSKKAAVVKMMPRRTQDKKDAVWGLVADALKQDVSESLLEELHTVVMDILAQEDAYRKAEREALGESFL